MKRLNIFLSMFLLGMTAATAQYTQTTTPTCLASPAGTPITFTFNSVPSPAAGGTVTVYYQGDFDNPTEFGTVFDENAVSLGQTPPSTSQCFASQDSVSFPLTVADLAAYAADGVITFSLTPESTVNPTLCNPCGVLNAKISYPPVTGPDDAAAVGIGIGTGAVFCSGVQPITADIVNAGTNQITSVMVNWEVNGVAQTPVAYTSTLDTLGGAGSNAATVALGSLTFSPGTTNIRAWTSMPNNVPDTSNLNDTTAISAGPSLAGTFTVDGSNPSAGSNFNNFGDLNAAFASFGVCGPVVVNVAPGTYTDDPLLLDNIVGSGMANPITIDGGDSSLVTLDNSLISNPRIVGFDNVSYVTVKNMTLVDNTGSTSDHFGVHFMNNAHHDSVINVRVLMNPTAGAGAMGIGASSSPTNDFGEGDNANFVTVMNCAVEGGSYSYHFEGPTTGNWNVGNTFINNSSRFADDYGFYFDQQDSVSVIGNHVSDLRATAADGITGFDCMNFKCNENYVHAPDYGIYWSDANSDRTPSIRAEVINNMIIADTDYGLYMTDALNVDVFHNSVTSGSTSTTVACFYLSGAVTSDVDARNNIFVSTNSYGMRITEPDTTTFLKCDNNLYESINGANLLDIDGTLYTDIASYKSAQPLFNTASLEGDPGFLSGTDLHIITATVNDLGDNTVGVLIDIDGDTRPIAGATSVDIGADEFNPPLCPPVANLATTNATLTSMDLYWDGTPGNSWQYEVTAAGAGQGTGTIGLVAMDSITVTGLASSSGYDFYVREICGRGDTSLWLGPVSANTSNAVPYFQDFENFGNNTSGLIAAEGWFTLNTPTPHWESGGSTSSSSTGPTADNTIGAGGTFLYLETSGGAQGDSDDLWSAPVYFDTSQNAVTLEFYYHMYGPQMGSLEVYAETSTSSTLITTITGQQQTAQGDAWISSTNVLGGYGGQSVQLRFKGIRGSGYQSDMSIDDVRLFVPAGQDGGVSDILAPGSGCGLGSADSVTVEITNFGTAALSGFPVSYVLNGGTPVTETYSGSIASGTTANYTFTTTVNLATPGTYDLVSYTGVANDGDTLNDTSATIINSIPILSSFPYTEGFETGNGGWTAGGTSSSWALGVPSGAVINSAAGGTQAWVTSLAGQYPANEQSFVQGPCFDFTSIAAPQFKAEIWWDSEFSWDGAALQSSVDGGATWQNVGAFGDPNNWYNDNTINGMTAVSNGEGWTGTGANGSGGWVLAEHDLTGLGGVSGVLLRFAFGSDGSGFGDGFAFDNILVQDAPAADAGVVELVRPVNACGLGSADSVEIRVINAGGAPIFNFPVNYELNAAAAVTETYTDTLFPGDTGNFVFNTTVNVSVPGTYSLVTYSSLAGDGNSTNDTLNSSFNNIPILSSFPYTEGFESGNGGWVAGGTSSSWALGTPAGTVINSAAGGTQAWVTNLTGDYNANEQSFVQGPCFDLTSLAAPQFKAEIWWDSEFSWDGAALQSSVDGGASWQHVGAFGDPNNWYNDNSINGFTGNQEGWTGTGANGSGGWVLAEHDLNGLGGVSGVLLRVAFGSDGSGFGNGFAFDNIVVQDAPAADVGVVSLDAPGSGCGLGAADSVKISVANFGSSTAMNFPVSFVFNGGTAVTETFTDSIQPGDTAQYTFTTATVNVSMFNTTYTFDAYSALAGDGNLLNDTLSGATVTNNTQSFPYNENFDALSSGQRSPFANGWTATAIGGTIPWQANSGSTTSTSTGPTGDNTTGSGIYMYTETSGATGGATGIIESPCIDLTTNTTSNLRLTYWYHMYGADIGSLNVEIDSMGTWILVDTINGQQQTANADPFFRAVVDLSAYAGLAGTKVRFMHTNYPGGYNGDVSIDDVALDDSTVTSIAVLESVQAYSLFPNPSNGEFTLAFDAENSGNMNVNVKDINGKLVYQNTYGVNGSFRTTFDFTSFAKGVYFMEIQTGDASRVEKLIIQ